MRPGIKPRIFIRADGSSKIGLGHIMRTGALAAELRRRGAEVVYITRYPQYIKDYPVVKVPAELAMADEPGLIGELLRSAQSASRTDGCGLVIDHYGFDQDGLDALAALSDPPALGVPLASGALSALSAPPALGVPPAADASPAPPGVISLIIDDMNLYEYNSTLVLNQNAYGPELAIKGSARPLLGARYLLLRREFADIPAREARAPVSDVLITMGAADPLHLTPRLMAMLSAYPLLGQCRWHVMVGPAFAHADEVRSLAVGQPAFVLHIDPPAIKEIMLLCDISISAAGSSVYELAACGVPSLLVVAADNQRPLAQKAAAMGWSCNLGEAAELDREKLWSTLDELLPNRQKREMMARLGQAAIDGQGAGRVAEELLGHMRRR